MYHKYLPTQPTPSPPVFPYSIGFLPKGFYLLVYPHGYPYSTVSLYSIGFTLDANDSHLDLEERIEAMHLF
jgi:hypothetical protein